MTTNCVLSSVYKHCDSVNLRCQAKLTILTFSESAVLKGANINNSLTSVESARNYIEFTVVRYEYNIKMAYRKTDATIEL